MYRPLPDGLTIRNSPIEGLGLFTSVDIKKNTFIGVTHIRDEQFENKYIRTPLGGFYNHSDVPTVVRMVTDSLPKLKFGDILDVDATTKKFPGKDNDGENVFFNLQEKPDAKYGAQTAGEATNRQKTELRALAHYNTFICVFYR